MRALSIMTLLCCILQPLVTRAADTPLQPVPALRAGHPRLLLSTADLATAKQAAATDPLRAALHARIIAIAEIQLKEKPIERILIGPRLLDKSRTAISRVLTGALAYRMSGDVRFAERAKKEMLTAAAFVDWNPSHFLDIAEMSMALALGYDWLYPELSPDERTTIRQALLDKSLVFAPAAYAPGGPTDKRLWFVTADHNWNQVCNGGLLAAALALADEKPELAQLVIDGVRHSLPLATAAYQPDGAFPEGPGYWSYGTSYNVLALALFESALGTDFDLGKAAAFDRTALYRLQVEGPTGQAFNYADGGTGLGVTPEFTWLAQRYHHAAALARSREQLAAELEKPASTKGDRFFALNAVWFPAQASQAVAEAPLDARFRGHAQLAVMRSAWHDPDALFVGFKAGSNLTNHSHLDLGSFVLESDGVRWAQDLGPDNYNLPGYFDHKELTSPRWRYFRLNNYSHNTLTVDHALQSPDADAPITAFGSTPARAYVIADLAPAYPGSAKKIQRGIAMLDRNRVLVQDEATGLKPGVPLSWHMMTGAQVTLDDQHHATLRQNGKVLKAEILAPANAKFTLSSAKPPTPAEKQNEAYRMLATEFNVESSEVVLTILLTPVGDKWPAQTAPPALTPLADWR